MGTAEDKLQRICEVLDQAGQELLPLQTDLAIQARRGMNLPTPEEAADVAMAFPTPVHVRAFNAILEIVRGD